MVFGFLKQQRVSKVAYHRFPNRNTSDLALRNGYSKTWFLISKNKSCENAGLRLAWFAYSAVIMLSLGR